METKVLNGVAAVTVGDWFSINELGKGLIPASLHIISVGALDGTITLDVSDEDVPTDNGAETIMTETVTVMKDISGNYKWYRANVPIWVSGVITVIIKS